MTYVPTDRERAMKARRPNPYRVPDAALRRAFVETVEWEQLRNREYPVDTTESRKEVR